VVHRGNLKHRREDRRERKEDLRRNQLAALLREQGGPGIPAMGTGERSIWKERLRSCGRVKDSRGKKTKILGIHRFGKKEPKGEDSKSRLKKV